MVKNFLFNHVHLSNCIFILLMCLFFFVLDISFLSTLRVTEWKYRAAYLVKEKLELYINFYIYCLYKISDVNFPF